MKKRFLSKDFPGQKGWSTSDTPENSHIIESTIHNYIGSGSIFYETYQPLYKINRLIGAAFRYDLGVNISVIRFRAHHQEHGGMGRKKR